MTPKRAASDDEAPPPPSAADGPAWQKLLDFIAGEGDGPEDAYQRTRARLVKFFAWRGSHDVEELADETLTRVARKLGQDGVQAERPMAFIIGVARMIDLEQKRRQGRSVTLSEGAAETPAPSQRKEELLAALERCLDKLSADDRQLLLRYHEPRGERRAAVRQVIADELGTALNALRVRMHRMRLQVEACVERCLASPSGSAAT